MRGLRPVPFWRWRARYTQPHRQFNSDRRIRLAAVNYVLSHAPAGCSACGAFMTAVAGQYQPTIYPASPAHWPHRLSASMAARRTTAGRSAPRSDPAADAAAGNIRTVAFITTPNFRAGHPSVVDDFIRLELYRLAQRFRIVCSGTTFDVVQEVLAKDFDSLTAQEKDRIAAGMELSALGAADYAAWRSRLLARLEGRLPGAAGVVEILFDLVEGRLAGVIHLAHPDDLESKADSRVLWRAANVHNVAIAHDVNTAASFVTAWRRVPDAPRGAAAPHGLDGPAAMQPPSALAGIERGERVIAIISHDGKKSEMCEFAENNAERIASYDCVLATATTGMKLAEALRAHDPAWPVHKIRCCLSGPEGGDIQIACAVVRGLCQKVVFFQDPWTSHPHEADIRLFEKVLLEASHPVELATNRSAADIIL